MDKMTASQSHSQATIGASYSDRKHLHNYSLGVLDLRSFEGNTTGLSTV